MQLTPHDSIILRSAGRISGVFDYSEWNGNGGRIFCCATWAKIEEGNKESPFNPIFGF
ncbi:hypothetical protein NECAME_19682 [Necator americanus]|uniref:Uncharacterized protein n=1 Tax=Necator americanus TaxID=51031 RepID=W2TK46_NECAM|nr:hypothetical protein NECAME_19682 [Necator americanus]ETN82450.1 hypothetical protein NECAME_19682 [Necator americanus]